MWFKYDALPWCITELIKSGCEYVFYLSCMCKVVNVRKTAVLLMPV